MIFTLEPTMITELIKFPRSRSICKISPLTKPNSTRFKRTAINSAISSFNKVDNSLASLALDKFKKGLKKVPLGEKPSKQILEDLGKSSTREVRPIINKKYPSVERDIRQNERTYYQDMRNLFVPPDEYTLEERIQKMEDYLYSIIDDEY